MTGPIFHLALTADWEATATEYRTSTIGRSLEDVGFIHCSTAAQLSSVADAFYWGRDDVLLLEIDPTAVGAEIRVEGGFPHVYGPVPTAAVRAATPVPVEPDGRLRVQPLVAGWL